MELNDPSNPEVPSNPKVRSNPKQFLRDANPRYQTSYSYSCAVEIKVHYLSIKFTKELTCKFIL